MNASSLAIAVILPFAVPLLAAAEPIPAAPITTVEIGRHGEFRVNGKPFLPLMSWQQKTSSYPKLTDLGFNVVMGNWERQPAAAEMATKALAAGAYAVPFFDGTGFAHPGVFGWAHEDEPDLSKTEMMGKVTAGAGLRPNKGAPIAGVVDGITHKYSLMDPLAGASFVIDNEKPATVVSLAAWVITEKDFSIPSEITFLGDGVEILRTPVEAKKGQQKWQLGAPATFTKLEVRITAATTGAKPYGAFGEIEAFDAAGVNVIKRESIGKMNQTPDVTEAEYRKIKAADPSRPVLLTITSRFMPRYEQWHKVPVEQMRAHYPRWAVANDALGVDIYPIYGFNKPEWLLDNIEALKGMRTLAGPGKPLYMWIETNNGGNAQKPDGPRVTPAITRAEVWMSLIAGAKAIGYFTHCFKPFNDFACEPDMLVELKRLNGQLTRLAPAILAEPAPVGISFDGGIAGHALGTNAEDGRYVFAQNLDLAGKAGTATVTLAGLKAGTRITVVDEGREIVAAEGSFSDTFAALAEHVYLIPR
jgi:hypothetical protein